MIWKNLGIMAVLFLCLGSFVYFYEIEGGKKREEAEEKAKQLFQFKKEDIASISLTRDENPITLKKDEDTWKLVQPIEARADKTVADGLASELGSAKVERSLAPIPIDWEAFGLESPKIKIKIGLKDGQAHDIEFGEKDFNESSIFARIPGQERILVLPSLLFSNADKKLFDFRDKRVIEFERDQVKKVEIRSKGKFYVLEKKENDWSIQKPIQAKADRSEVNAILSDLEFARLEEFMERGTPLRRYGLKAPRARVDLYLGDNQARKTLLIGQKTGESQYYAKDEVEEDVFKVKEDLVTKLALDLQKLRDKKMVRFERNEVKRVEVKLPEKQFEFVRDLEGKWRMENPSGYKEKSILEYKLFWPLEDLEGKEIVDQANLEDPKYGFMQPSAEVKLVKQDETIIEIVLGKTKGEVVFAKSATDPTLYKVDKKVLEDLNFKVDEIMEKSE